MSPADVAVMPPPPLPEGPVQRRPMSPPRPARPPVDASNCLWVGNLACDVSDDILRAYFEEFGMLDDVHVVRDPHTRRSKGFALRFVTESQLAILNRQVRIKRSAPRPPRNRPGASSGRGVFGERGGRGGGRGGMRGGRGGGFFRGGPPRPFNDRPPDQQRDYPKDRHGGSHRSGYDDRRSGRDYPNDRHSGSHRSGYDDTRHHGDRKRHASYDDCDRDRDRGHSRDYGHDSRRQDEHRRHRSHDDHDRWRRSSYDGGSGSGRDYRDRDRERSPRRDYR
ncbi:Heteroproteinous nuclear ribonucleoprotein A1 [Allomyces arbusculus]|nr:Heteroproteinous nuclear ribonucleoprotein A1 [Allomyces arbusculus]